jgi:sulfopyruvate decarboxylase subunit beta
VVVSNLGQASLDLQQIADRPLNCYTFGAMGQCSSIGLGIALARPDVRVICLDGDGSLLMNLGSLCTIANQAPRNYALVIWVNEVHQTTGGQPTATASRSSLAALARGAGIDKAMEVRTERTSNMNALPRAPPALQAPPPHGRSPLEPAGSATNPIVSGVRTWPDGSGRRS